VDKPEVTESGDEEPGIPTLAAGRLTSVSLVLVSVN
jgi:hypothetical protein